MVLLPPYPSIYKMSHTSNCPDGYRGVWIDCKGNIRWVPLSSGKVMGTLTQVPNNVNKG